MRTASPARVPGQPESDASSSNVPVDTSYLESLVGYNARRVAAKAMGSFGRRMARYELRPVDFSVLSIVAHNPGVTSRQLCRTLDVLPPNLVGIVGSIEKRGLIERQPHPDDGRAISLHLTTTGRELIEAAEITATELETDVASALTPAENRTLIRLLKKIYR